MSLIHANGRIKCSINLMGALGLLLVSCARNDHGYWSMPGVTQAQFETLYRRDTYECERESTQTFTAYNSVPMGNGIMMMPVPIGGVDSSMFNKCMYARGYNWTRHNPTTATQKLPTKLINKVEREDSTAVSSGWRNDHAVCLGQASTTNDYSRCMQTRKRVDPTLSP